MVDLGISLALGIGVGLGVFLQKGRFCFVSAFRDFFASKDSRVLRGVVAGVMTMTAGVGFAYYLGTPVDHFWIPNFGLNSIIGGFVFGIGMSVGGGCASGTLYRAAQGYLHYWIVLAFTVLGYVIFAQFFDTVFLPYYFVPLQVFDGVTAFSLVPRGEAPILGLGVVGAAFLGYSAVYRGNLRFTIGGIKLGGRSDASMPSSISKLSTAPAPIQSRPNLAGFFRGHWNTTWCGVGIGILASAWFALWSTWSVTGPEIRWTGLLVGDVVGFDYLRSNSYWSGVVFSAHGFTISLDMIMLAGLMAGALMAAVWSGDFRIRRPLPKRLPNMIAGGLLMGFGARLAPGCNISNAFGGVATLSISSALSALGLIVGVYLATHWMFRKVGCAL